MLNSYCYLQREPITVEVQTAFLSANSLFIIFFCVNISCIIHWMLLNNGKLLSLLVKPTIRKEYRDEIRSILLIWAENAECWRIFEEERCMMMSCTWWSTKHIKIIRYNWMFYNYCTHIIFICSSNWWNHFCYIQLCYVDQWVEFFFLCFCCFLQYDG